MFTSMIFDGTKPELWHQVEPYLLDLVDNKKLNIYETNIMSPSYIDDLENISNFAAKDSTNNSGNFRIIVILSASLTQTDPFNNYLAKRIEIIEELVIAPQKQKPREVHYIIVDDIDRNSDYMPLNDKACLAWELDTTGYITKWKMLGDEPAFAGYDFQLIDMAWNDALKSIGVDTKNLLVYKNPAMLQNKIQNSAEDIINNILNAYDEIMYRIINNRFNSLSVEDKLILKSKFGENFMKQTEREKVLNYLSLPYSRIKEKFMRQLNDIKRGIITVAPSIKLKQIIHYEKSLISKCLNRRITWFELKNIENSQEVSMLNLVFLIRSITYDNDNMFFKNRINSFDIEFNIIEMSKFLSEYMNSLMNIDKFFSSLEHKAEKIKIEVCPLLSEDYNIKDMLNTIEMPTEIKSLIKKLKHKKLFFLNSLFYSKNEKLKWNRYISSITQIIKKVDEISRDAKETIKSNSNTNFDLLKTEQKEYDINELYVLIQTLNNKAHECELKIKELNINPSSLQNSYLTKFEELNKTLLQKFEEKVHFKTFVVSDFLAVLIIFFFYPFTQKNDMAYISNTLFFFLIMMISFIAIQATTVFLHKLKTDKLIWEINSLKDNIIKSKEKELLLFKEYIKLITIIKLCRKYIDYYEEKIGKIGEVANKILYHKQSIENQIQNCETIMKLLNIDYQNYEFNSMVSKIDYSKINNEEELRKMSSPFSCSINNQNYIVKKKDMPIKDNKSISLGEISTKQSGVEKYLQKT